MSPEYIPTLDSRGRESSSTVLVLLSHFAQLLLNSFPNRTLTLKKMTVLYSDWPLCRSETASQASRRYFKSSSVQQTARRINHQLLCTHRTGYLEMSAGKLVCKGFSKVKKKQKKQKIQPPWLRPAQFF